MVSYKKCHLCGDVGDECVLFMFPNDVERRRVWSEFCGTDIQPRKLYYLCSRHFEKNCIIPKQANGRRPVLRRNATPSLHSTIKIGTNPQSVDELRKQKKPKSNCGVRKCLWCGENTDRTIPLFRFPSESGTSRQWLSFCDYAENEAVNPNWRLCAKHFSLERVVRGKSGRVNLLPNSVPLIRPLVVGTTSEGPSSTELEEVPADTLNEEIVDTSERSSPTYVPISESEMSPPSTAMGELISLADVEVSTPRSVPEMSPPTTGPSSSAEVIPDINPRESTPSNRYSRRMFRSPRYAGDIRTPHMETPRRTSKYLSMMRNELCKTREKVKQLQVTNARLRARLTCTRELVQHLVEKSLLSEKASHDLMITLPESAQCLIMRQLASVRTAFAPELRAFALTLHFYSSKAYNYVRRVWNKLLPDESTLRRWYSSIDGRPGFTDESFAALKAKTDRGRRPIVCNLVLDEMSIREQVQFNNKNGRTFGYEDLGTNLVRDVADSAPLANHALVFCAVNLKEKWKLPMAYFLIKNLDGKERASLLKICLQKMQEVHAHVRSITFDGTAVNLTMCKYLGANLEVDSSSFQPWFSHPANQKKVYIFPDPSHMVKLVRNAIGAAGPFFDVDGKEITFEYMFRLFEFEQKEGLRAGTNLTNQHVHYANNKMNVRLAAQVLSNSVADALIYLKEDMNEPTFRDADATAKFCRMMDKAYAILNCRNIFSIDRYCTPLRESNFSFLSREAKELVQYMNGLKDKEGVPVIHSRRKTGFTGFIICLENLFPLFYDLRNIEHYDIEYLLTYKLLQDHLENLFSAIRQYGGHNNNPSAQLFETIYKRLLVRHEVSSSENANCGINDVQILFASSGKKRVHSDDFIMEEDDETLNDDSVDVPLSNLSLFVEDTAKYIAGFIAQQLKKRNLCSVCLAHVLRKPVDIQDHISKLAKRKTRGGLLSVSTDAANICVMAERVFRAHKDRIHQRNFLNIVTLRTRTAVGTSLFTTPEMEDHVKQQAVLEDHRTRLIEIIAEKYLKIRIHHEMKKLSEKKKYIRQKNTKLTLFLHQ